MRKILLNLLFLFSTILQGKPDILWTRTFGGSDNNQGYSVQQNQATH